MTKNDWTIRVVCPALATYAINSYREPARLFIARSDKEILREEGATQGDNLAMGIYACATVPVILSTFPRPLASLSLVELSKIPLVVCCELPPAL